MARTVWPMTLPPELLNRIPESVKERAKCGHEQGPMGCYHSGPDPEGPFDCPGYDLGRLIELLVEENEAMWEVVEAAKAGQELLLQAAHGSYMPESVRPEFRVAAMNLRTALASLTPSEGEKE